MKTIKTKWTVLLTKGLKLSNAYSRVAKTDKHKKHMKHENNIFVFNSHSCSSKFAEMFSMLSNDNEK